MWKKNQQSQALKLYMPETYRVPKTSEDRKAGS